MLIAEIAGNTLSSGDTVEIQAMGSQYRFKILEVRKNSFRVSWLDGDKSGDVESVPHSLLGLKVTVTEVLDDEQNPNAVFKMKKRRMF